MFLTWFSLRRLRPGRRLKHLGWSTVKRSRARSCREHVWPEPIRGRRCALEGDEVLDFHSQPFVVDHAGDLREPVAIGPDDVFAIDADSRRHLGDRPGEVDHPPALAERPHHLVRRLARNAVEHLVDAAWISGADRRDDVLGRVVDDRLGPEGADEVVVPPAGRRDDARPDPRGDLDGEVANASRGGRDQYHVASLDRKDVRQGLMRGQPDNRYPARPRQIERRGAWATYDAGTSMFSAQAPLW